MTVSTLLGIGGERADHGDAEASAAGVVSVHVRGLADSTAACSCGWSGHRRFLKAAAEQDAWTHCMHEHCAVSSPLVTPW